MGAIGPCFRGKLPHCTDEMLRPRKMNSPRTLSSKSEDPDVARTEAPCWLPGIMSHPQRRVGNEGWAKGGSGGRDELATYLMECRPWKVSRKFCSKGRGCPGRAVSGVPEGVPLHSGPFLLHAVTQGDPLAGRCLQSWQQRAVLREQGAGGKVWGRARWGS